MSLARQLKAYADRTPRKIQACWFLNNAAGRALVDFMLFPIDLLKILRLYKSAFGRLPRLLTPRTFNEKLQRSKLVRRRSRYVLYADKLSVRRHVEKTIGAKYLTRLLWQGTRLDECECFDHLPDSFVIKTNQGSGTNIFCRNKRDFDWAAAVQQTKEWLELDHSIHCGEWQYRWILPKVFIEELLLDENGAIPVDYKFFCFDGKVSIIQVDYDRATCHTRLLFDKQFSLLNVEFQYPKFTGMPLKPARFDEMVWAAEALATGEEFIRVDLYELSGKVVFGELTLHPEAGLGRFLPAGFDFSLGQLMR